MPIKICFITNYAYRLFNQKSRIAFGGIETIFSIVANDLIADKRFEVNFLLEDDVHKKPQTEIIDGITLYKTSRKHPPLTFQDEQIKTYHRLFIYWASKLSWLGKLPHFDFFRLWEKIKQIQADVYIFASPGYESGLITFLTKVLKKKSVFIVANDELFRTKDKIFLYALKYADIIWCFSKRHQKLLLNKYKIKAVYLAPWYPRPKKFLPQNQRKYFLWVGRIETRKQPQALLKLSRRLPKIPFLMVMAPSPNEPALFKSITKEAAKIPNLRIKQDVMFNRLELYYQSALAFIDTSDYKNLNMTQVQAAYSKTPCLSLFYDPNASFKEYGWGLSANGDMGQMVKNINTVLTRKRLLERLSNNSYSFADSVYNQKDNLRAFKQLIFRLTK